MICIRNCQSFQGLPSAWCQDIQCSTVSLTKRRADLSHSVFRLIFISEHCTFIHTFIYIRVFSLKYYFHSVSKICAALVKGCFWCSLRDILDLVHHVGNFQHDDKLQVFQFLKFSNFYWFGFAGLAYTFSTASERSSPFDRNFFGSKDHPHISQDW